MLNHKRNIIKHVQFIVLMAIVFHLVVDIAASCGLRRIEAWLENSGGALQTTQRRAHNHAHTGSCDHCTDLTLYKSALIIYSEAAFVGLP